MNGVVQVKAIRLKENVIWRLKITSNVGLAKISIMSVIINFNFSEAVANI